MEQPIIQIGNGKWAIKENNFLGYTQFDGFRDVDSYTPDSFSFTRNTSATVTNSQGYIEDSCFNLITGSDPISSAGSNTSSIVTYSAYTWGVAGLVNSTVYAENSFGGTRYQGSTIQGLTYYMSFYVKMNDNSKPVHDFSYNANGDFTVVGAGDNVPAVTITYAGNNVWLVETIFTAGPNPGSSNGIVKYANKSSKGFIVSGYNLVLSSIPRPYLSTTNRLNVPKIDFKDYTSKKNLITYSEQLNNWSKPNINVLPNVIANPIDGNINVDKIIQNTSNAVHYIEPQFYNTLSSAQYTLSFYAKAGESTKIQVNHSDGISGFIGDFDLTAGTKTSGNGTITNVNDGWYKIVMTRTSNVTPSISARPQILMYANDGINLTYVGDGVSGLYLWGFQSEQSSSATTYQKTTFTNITNGALSIEPQRSNLLIKSEEIDSASWTRQAISATTNAIAAPNNTITADKLVEDNTFNNHQFLMNVVVASSTVYTTSFYAKAGERTAIYSFEGNNIGAAAGARFNLTAGTISSIGGITTNSSMLDVGNGWWRCSYTYQTLSAQTNVAPLFRIVDVGDNQYSGNGISGLYVWGVQHEASGFLDIPTSYIPTTVAAITRNGDSITALSNMNIYLTGKTEGAIFLDFYNSGINVQSGLIMLSPLSTNASIVDTINFRFNGGNSLGATIINNNVYQSDFIKPITPNARHKLLLRYSSTNIAFYIDGIKTDDVSGSFNIPININYLHLVNYFGATPNINIYNIRVYDRTLSNSESISITTL